MRVLITNAVLDGRTGTETFTRDLAFALQGKGHTPIIYTHQKGDIGQEINARGIPVTDDIMSIAGDIDVIHGHHTIPTAIAIMRFPKKPALFVCHDFTAWHDAPPSLPSLTHFVAIGRTSASRLNYLSGIPLEQISIIANGVDFSRFRPGPELPVTPARALAFSRSLELAVIIRQACFEQDIAVDVVGEAARIVDRPECLMTQYDIVFASGRTAQEALACERAVICCDSRGLAGMITRESFERWGENLGLVSLSKSLSVQNFVSEIRNYDAKESQTVAKQIKTKMSMEICADKYIDLYTYMMETQDDLEIAENELRDAHCRLFQSYNPHIQNFYPWVIERKNLFRELLSERLKFEEVPSDKYLSFGLEGLAWAYCSVAGFYGAEAEHIWSSSQRCFVRFNLPLGTIKCTLIVDANAIIPIGCLSNTARLTVNSHETHSLSFERPGKDLTQTAVSARKCCNIELNLTVPNIEIMIEIQASSSCLPDRRCMGIGLFGLSLIYN